MKKAVSGYGSVSIDKNCVGGPMIIEGYPPASPGSSLLGIGTHAPSIIGFDLPPNVVAFEAKAGLDKGGTSQNRENKVIAMVFDREPGEDQLAAHRRPPEKSLGFAAANELMSGFKTPAGLAATLVAAEPQIQNPTNIDIDHRGRIWALEAVNYRSSFKPWGVLRPEGDRVVILEDSDHDGIADKETTFYQNPNLTNPLGLLVLPQPKGTKVIVAASPHLWLLTDADGDDQAEKAEVLLKVGGNFDHDHNLHAVVFGPDGKFYFNFGNEGRKLVTPDDQPLTDLAGNLIDDSGKPYRQGIIFRCDIDLQNAKVSNLETLAHNFRNNYELCLDSFGGAWQSDNDDDGNKAVRINAILDYGNYGYTDEITGAGWRTPRTHLESEIPDRHWHQNDPGTIPNLLVTGGGSPTGILVNESPLLGKTFENQIIHCDAGPRTTRAYPTQQHGAGYRAGMVDILTTDDTWYRPSDLSIAPDGSLFIADWYDPGVGGHNMGDNSPGKIRGRLYRVAPAGHLYQPATPDFSTLAGNIAALQSPNHATRYIAWNNLHAQGAAAQAALEQLARQSSANPRDRARAFQLLLEIPGHFTTALQQAATDPDPDIRAMAARRFRLAAATGKLLVELNQDPASWLLQQAKNETHKQVLREHAITLRILPGSDTLNAAWLELAKHHHGDDRWYLEALGIATIGHEDAFLGVWLEHAGDGWNTPAGRDLIWRIRSSQAADYLARLLTDKTASPEILPRYLRAFDFLPDTPARLDALVKIAVNGTPSVALTVDVLQRLGKTSLKDNPEVTAARNRLLASLEDSPDYIGLALSFNLSDKDPQILAVALKNPGYPSALEGVRHLLRHPSGNEQLSQTLDSPQAETLITILGGIGEPSALDRLTALLIDPQRSPALRAAALKALSLSATGATALIQLAEQDKFPAELKSAAGLALGMVHYPGISEKATKLFPPPTVAGGEALPSVAELIKLKGDAARGKIIFEKAESTCVLCHRAGSAGVDFGPGLGEIGAKLGKDALYQAILDPNAGVSMGFETWQLTLKNGQNAIGIIRSETNDKLDLVMPGGVTSAYKKQEIASRQKLPGTMMPPGLQQMFTRQDLVDLVEYLASLKGVAAK